MNWNDTESDAATIYQVVVNDDEQYSIWPDHCALPSGWRHAGKIGPKAECLAYIKEVWTDMRPLSLRRKMEAFAVNPPPRSLPSNPIVSHQNSLVDRLCQKNQVVEVGRRSEKTAKLFKQAIDRDYVHIKFTQTNGGTELGFRLDPDASVLNAADFEVGKGIAHLEGNLTLDYVKVRCVADIDLSTLQGKGHLVRL